MPIIGATLGAATGWVIGLSAGSAAILITLSASASYIAAPVAMRLALPAANPAIADAGSRADVSLQPADRHSALNRHRRKDCIVIELHSKKRIEVIVETPMQTKIIEVLDTSGAPGYSVLPVLRGMSLVISPPGTPPIISQ